MTERPSVRASDPAINQATERSADRATKRSSDRTIERSSGRGTARPNDRATERSSDRAIERPSDRAIETQKSNYLRKVHNSRSRASSDTMPEPSDVENCWVTLFIGIGASNHPNCVQTVTQKKTGFFMLVGRRHCAKFKA